MSIDYISKIYSYLINKDTKLLCKTYLCKLVVKHIFTECLILHTIHTSENIKFHLTKDALSPGQETNIIYFIKEANLIAPILFNIISHCKFHIVLIKYRLNNLCLKTIIKFKNSLKIYISKIIIKLSNFLNCVTT